MNSETNLLSTSHIDIHSIDQVELPSKARYEDKGVYRLFNGVYHLFTNNAIEIDILTGQGWANEGMSIKEPYYDAVGGPTSSVFRFFVEGENRHFYTANIDEKDSIINNPALKHYKLEGVAFDVLSVNDKNDNIKNNMNPIGGTIAVCRYVNNSTGHHLYSSSSVEQSGLESSGIWTKEGVAWYGTDAYPEISTPTIYDYY